MARDCGGNCRGIGDEIAKKFVELPLYELSWRVSGRKCVKEAKKEVEIKEKES